MNKNSNTPKFWSKLNLLVRDRLTKSPIYLKKRNIVVKWIDNGWCEILSVGIGNAHIEEAISIEKKSIKLYGVDFSKKTISRISKSVKGKFVKANATKLPFKDRKFDTVLALDVLEHLNKFQLHSSLTEIYRVLKEGGGLIVSIPLNESHKDFRKNAHLYRFTEQEIVNRLSNYGFARSKSVALTAFKKNFEIKNFINNIFRLRKTNLFIGKFQKQ